MAGTTILVLGSRGTVGSAIMAAAGDRAVAAARLPVAPGTLPFDAATDDVCFLLDKTKAAAVVLAFGISGTHTCASIPEQSRLLNVDRVIAITAAVAQRGALPVLLSSDCVFDGSPTIWSEEDKANPICEYGRQKRDTENAIAELRVPYLILRLSRVIADHACRRDLVYQWCALIHARKPVQLAMDQCFRPIAAADLGRIVVQLIDSRARGLIQVAGPQQVTSPQLFEMLHSCLQRAGLQVPVERELCRVRDLPGLEPRPAYTLLSIERLKSIVDPHFLTLEESVRSVAERSFAIAPDRQHSRARLARRSAG